MRARTGGPVYLTMAHLDPEFVRRRFPTIARACREAGFDLAVDRVPVSPAAHYVMGGVETDLQGRTSLAGLFAAGEAACTGVHGANRLASNSLLEGLVFGARAAEAMRGSTVSPSFSATVGEPIALSAIVTDDGIPAPRPAPRQSVGFRSSVGLRVAWFVFRGQGNAVTFDPEQIKVYPDFITEGGNSPWSPGTL